MISIVSRRGGYRAQEGDIDCSRSGPFGNQFVLRDEHDLAERARVCAQFEAWLIEHPERMEAVQHAVDRALAEFGQCRLVCWCAPRQCHVESYVRRLS